MSKSFIFFAEDGQVKYKVHFEDRVKRLVSAHHIAFGHSSKLQQLFVGSRVVIKTQANRPHLCPGVLTELPHRRNNMRCVFNSEPFS